MNLGLCHACGMHIFKRDAICPHCGRSRGPVRKSDGRRAAVAMLLGIGLAGCGDDAKDTSEASDTSESLDTSEWIDQPAYGVPDTGVVDEAMYGVPATDMDGDGFLAEEDDCDDTDASTFPGSAENDSETECMTDADGDGYGSSTAASPVAAGTDCDDSNASIHPGADETEGDGDDSNCDGEEGS
jgi:hypothetical protein